MGEIKQLRDQGRDTEKITINLGHVDLGRIDLMVRDGFYSNRTDLIRTAIRTHLAGHADQPTSQVPFKSFYEGQVSDLQKGKHSVLR